MELQNTPTKSFILLVSYAACGCTGRSADVLRAQKHHFQIKICNIKRLDRILETLYSLSLTLMTAEPNFAFYSSYLPLFWSSVTIIDTVPLEILNSFAFLLTKAQDIHAPTIFPL